MEHKYNKGSRFITGFDSNVDFRKSWNSGRVVLQFLVLITMLFSLQATAQNVVRGVITDQGNGEALPGVAVQIKGTPSGVVTDIDGKYSISASSDDILVFSFVGFKTTEVPINGRSVVDFSLTADLTELSEVVVTAFGIAQEKKQLGYAVTELGGDKFTQSRAINLGSALTGKVAGVNVSPPATGAAGSSRVVIRGGSSLTGNDQPLYVVNGIPMDNSNLGSAGMWGGNDNGDGLASLNPDDIESLTVLKGATASALYGSRASNGVILITTKSGQTGGDMQVTFNSNFTV